MHYSRVPHELWRDRLIRMKRAGYNVVQTYAFWNYHEPREGEWDFSGDHDIEAFLKLIHELGMYAVVRVGPYVNAEWDSGGLPVWLRFKPWMAIDTENQAYYQAMDTWYEKIFGIVARNDVAHGGSVILVQLTNEDPRGAGTDLPAGFFTHLRDTAIRDGLEVPYFFSGVNHGDAPVGASPIDVTRRKSPWFSSEFWTGWFNMYRPDAPHATKLVRSTWQTIAVGGTGYAHYMMVGGTNFG
jgi:beta-galactosidase